MSQLVPVEWWPNIITALILALLAYLFVKWVKSHPNDDDEDDDFAPR